MASPISSCASPCGLPVSWCTTSASWAIRRVRTPRHWPSTSLRPSKPRPAHQPAASRARATAASTAAASSTACIPTTSPVAGLRDSSLSRAVVSFVGRSSACLSAQEVGGTLADHDRGGVGVAAGDHRHHAGVGDPEAVDPAHPQLGDRRRHVRRCPSRRCRRGGRASGCGPGGGPRSARRSGRRPRPPSRAGRGPRRAAPAVRSTPSRAAAGRRRPWRRGRLWSS